MTEKNKFVVGFVKPNNEYILNISFLIKASTPLDAYSIAEKKLMSIDSQDFSWMSLSLHDSENENHDLLDDTIDKYYG